MDVAKGILTAIGGKSSHAAVVARGMGTPLRRRRRARSRIDEAQEGRHRHGRRQDHHREGRRLASRSTAPPATSICGQAETIEPDPHSRRTSASSWSWADEFRGNFGVRANADIPRDAKVARAVRRRRHRPLPHRAHVLRRRSHLPHMQAMILARDEKTRRKALQKLLPMQRKDFAGLFKAMDGFPVVIRTLDPPLHEFLPKREDLMVDLRRAALRRYQDEEGDVAKYYTLRRRSQESEEGNCRNCCIAWKSCTSSTRCSAIAAAASASPIPRSRKCRRAPSSKPPCRWRRRA